MKNLLQILACCALVSSSLLLAVPTKQELEAKIAVEKTKLTEVLGSAKPSYPAILDCYAKMASFYASIAALELTNVAEAREAAAEVAKIVLEANKISENKTITKTNAMKSNINKISGSTKAAQIAAGKKNAAAVTAVKVPQHLTYLAESLDVLKQKAA